MAITAVRIDGRLIHGQVANLWTTKLGVTRIMVIDDQVAASDIEKAGLKLARPAGVDLSVLPEKVAADHINRGGYDSQKVFIVVKRPQILLDLVNDGVKLEAVNVGNMSQTDETTQLTNSINVVQEDVMHSTRCTKRELSLLNKWFPVTKRTTLWKFSRNLNQKTN